MTETKTYVEREDQIRIQEEGNAAAWIASSDAVSLGCWE